MQSKPFAITLDVGTSLLNKTGTWRNERPVYLDRLPPCNHTCPAGENIQAWLGFAEEGDYEAAWRQIMEDNPLPATMGRVCYHTCEGACNRAGIDEAVGINSVERFLGDQALMHGWRIDAGSPTGKKVMIVGAGPAGLSAAYHLRRLGHEVTVFDANPQAGGMIRYGIPKYRMPREKLRAEVARIEAMGVKIELNTKIEDISTTRKEGQFDAVFMCIGAQLSRSAEIESDGKIPIHDAAVVLRDSELDNPNQLHGHVVIYGGGNTAMDVARTSIRMGAISTTVVVLEAQEDMPAHSFERDEAIEEGATLKYLHSIKRVNGRTVTLEKMKVSENRWPKPTGEFDSIEADVIVQAIGQDVDTAILQNTPAVNLKDGITQINEAMCTGEDGIFAGGDMVPSQRTVTSAIGHGKKAARNINAYLRGEEWVAPDKHEVVTPDMLNTWYYSDAPRTVRPMLDVVRRKTGFAEVVGDLDVDNAVFEARRCMSCGNCFECDNCYGVCPDNAITKLGPGNRFKFKYDYCKGCSICATECPCGAIKMVPEDI
ncbi:MAG: NAD(P)-binding protein [Alphaproteobacteria bacterium]|nr:NAD(P)-binding protein [Alphaproteobacteria bacterium]MBT4085122.1 NAD(P)-binding protein [Alphaproteobacteria bacterium]MBT4543262.1 NAD(P)-binding protein [Alphaproteobacteria bacterium]